MTKFTVLNTRPKASLKITHEAFAKQGYAVIDFPCIEITAEKDKNKIQKQLASIKAQDVLIFTSQHAVFHAFNSFKGLNITNNVVVVAIGIKTAQVLEQNYKGDIWTPQQQNSEGVIDLLQGLANCHAIKLITAQNGRTAIQQYATENNIHLEQINVYKRQLPTSDKHLAKTIIQTQKLFILATNVTTLNNLQVLFKNDLPKILSFPVICSSLRIETAAQKMGHSRTINVNTAKPELMALKLKNKHQLFQA